jgi:hypothetical protein
MIAKNATLSLCPDCVNPFARKSSRSTRCPECQRVFREGYLRRYRKAIAVCPAYRKLLQKQKRESKRRARQRSTTLAAHGGGKEF